MRRFGLFIDGRWQSGEGDRTVEDINPATEEAWAEVAAASRADADKAVAAAKRALSTWRQTSRSERADFLETIANGIFERQDELVDIEVADNGSTLQKAGTADVPTAAQCFLHFAELLRTTAGEEAFTEDIPVPSRNLVVDEPYGVCAGIVPWNFPLAAASMKIAPALAAGNTYVLKPSPYTPVSALVLAEIITDAGVSPGVVNVISAPEDELGEALTTHPDVAKISFTGSTRVGREIMRKAASSVKSVTLELGGKSPNIILDDADLDVAVPGALFGTFFHAGQICTSGTRVLVPHSLYDEFVERMVEGSRRIKLGDPTDPETTMGPLAFEAHRTNVERYVDIATREGARYAVGGKRPKSFDRGYYYEPTIFTHVDNRMQIAQEEVFGPVVCIIPYDGSDEEALAIANDTMYGLASAIWSKDIDRALRLARRIESGTVWINDYHLLNVRFPFGGVKQSGKGREFGHWGYQEYCQAKHIHVGELSSLEEKYYFQMLLGES